MTDTFPFPKVNLQRSCSYYELHDPSKHYDHIVCTHCGKVVLLDQPCPLAETEKCLADTGSRI
jgi:Fe2+ or Zn2+ uptake regulation protein